MAKKTQQEIDQMVALYAKLKNYSAVARELNIAATTVSKYVKIAQNIELAEKPVKNPFDKKISLIDDIPFPIDWKKLLLLSSDEKRELTVLQEEIYLK